MEQNNIRPFNNQQYTIDEGASIIEELDKRTRYGNQQYNSIQVLGEKMRLVEEQSSAAISGYRGTIVIADTPTEDGVYTPTEAGTYTNAGGLIYAPDTTDQGKFVQFIKTGANWVKHTVSGGAYSKNETDVYRTLMESDILNSNQITTMVGGLPSTIVHKRAGVTIRTDTYTFTGNQIVESRELPTGERVTITTNTLTLTTDIIYYGI